MPPFTVHFYRQNGKLIRCLTIGDRGFIEQFDSDGWYDYHGEVFQEIKEPEAIVLALSILQKTNQNYKNEGRAKFRIYEFSLLHFSQSRNPLT